MQLVNSQRASRSGPGAKMQIIVMDERDGVWMYHASAKDDL